MSLSRQLLTNYAETPAIETRPIIGAPSQNLDNDDDDIAITITDDREPLLPINEPAVTKLTVAQRMAISAKNGALYALKHPVTTFTAVITATPPALNGVVAPTHDSPSVISPEWWSNLSIGQQIYASANATACFGVNLLVNVAFLALTVQKFKERARHSFDSVGLFASNSASLILGTSAALASGMISYNSYSWLPSSTYSALAPAVFSFIAAFASRYVGVMAPIDRIKRAYSADHKLQQRVIDLIGHIDAAQLERVQAEFAETVRDLHNDNEDKSKPLSDAQMMELTSKFMDRMELLFQQAAENGHDITRPTTTAEQAQKITAQLFDLIIGISLLAPCFLTHMQKGYDGINIIATMSGSDSVSTLDVWAKRAVGMVPGIAPAVLYGLSGYDFRATAVKMGKHCYQHPLSIPFAILFLAANYLSASSMQSVAENLMKNKGNIVGFNSDNEVLSIMFIALVAIGGALTNFKSSANLFYSTTPTPESVKMTDVANYLGRYDVTINKDTAAHLRTLSIFNDNPAVQQPFTQLATAASVNNPQNV